MASSCLRTLLAAIEPDWAATTTARSIPLWKYRLLSTARAMLSLSPDTESTTGTSRGTSRPSMVLAKSASVTSVGRRLLFCGGIGLDDRALTDRAVNGAVVDCHRDTKDAAAAGGLNRRNSIYGLFLIKNKNKPK